MNNIETMKLALEALEYFRDTGTRPSDLAMSEDAIECLVKAIEQAQQAEPALWTGVDFDIKTSPPPRQPLTDEEIKTIFKSNIKHDITDAFSFARAIEAAVLEKQK